ncbi:hypothetical protein GCM10010965_27590 [Caldalkalibacillus thermarum]|uniref:SAF domain-containing protein n=1 Tax=Caldalkalibacillus thermarum TaxID=296745 RepID=UPI001665DF65|nr:SAF domain-containing protein [Caldalkalibacillus thermarum]GGK33207.1 hypothetical protein GCM10010965_27590 [Caldalkalibacillus thermarum]
MKSRLIRIVLALVVAVGAGVGYYVYAQPEPGKTGYIALEDIPAGHVLEAEKLAFVEIHTDVEDYAVLAPEDVVGKVTDVAIRQGELINPSFLRDETVSENIRYYTQDVSYVRANGPIVKEGMVVDVWASATENHEARQILSGVRVHRLVPHQRTDDGSISPNQNVSVVFEMTEEQIRVVEAAKQYADLFLVVRGDELR